MCGGQRSATGVSPTPTLRQGLLSQCMSDQLGHRLLRLFLFLLPGPPYWDTRAVGWCHHIWLPIFILEWHMCPCLGFPQPVSYTPCLSKAIISFACQHGNTDEVGGWSNRFWRLKSDTSRSFFFFWSLTLRQWTSLLLLIILSAAPSGKKWTYS